MADLDSPAPVLVEHDVELYLLNSGWRKIARDAYPWWRPPEHGQRTIGAALDTQLREDGLR